MLPSRDIMDTARSVMRYARTDRGKKVIGTGGYLLGGAMMTQSYLTNPNQVTNRMRVGAGIGMAGTLMTVSGMKSLKLK